ncbi:MAG TPA: hypothetical protein VNI77_02405 [Nitrososphaera sp.]|nr:hypothetical protein [Nitrososphaera sp.]
MLVKSLVEHPDLVVEKFGRMHRYRIVPVEGGLSNNWDMNRH